MILVCGEAIIDFLRIRDGGETPMSFAACLGGSPFNVAFGVARLDAPSAFLSCLSTDFFGQQLEDFLRQEGVDLSWLAHSDHPTTLAFVQVGSDGSPQYSFVGERAADRMLSPEMLPQVLPSNIQALSFGSFSLAVEPCGSAYESLLHREAQRRVVAFDPNIRTRLVANMDVYRQRLARVLKSVSLVKVSTEDLRALYGPVNPEEIARQWRALGPALVIVTDGPNGAHVLLGNEWISFPGKAVAVVDTVGAGDTFQAALLAGFHRRGLLTHDALRNLTSDKIRPVIEECLTAAAITCMTQGANLPRLADVLAV